MKRVLPVGNPTDSEQYPADAIADIGRTDLHVALGDFHAEFWEMAKANRWAA